MHVTSNLHGSFFLLSYRSTLRPSDLPHASCKFSPTEIQVFHPTRIQPPASQCPPCMSHQPRGSVSIPPIWMSQLQRYPKGLRREIRSPKGGHLGRGNEHRRVGARSDTYTNAIAMPLLALFDAETAVAPRGMSLERSQAQEPRNRRSFERRTKVDESLAPFAEVGEEWSVLLLGGRNYIAYEENEYTVRRFGRKNCT